MNRLINESSPYLLQHAHNPVDWYPWSEEALQKAKDENKPIIVSIGYATCHWCHVMEKQSFENEAIAAYMNQHFVCIKIDREERQDLDSIYMEAVQAMGVNGGWPLNVFLMPDTKPFYGGTYYPPEHWLHLLHQIVKTFELQPDKLAKSSEQLTEIINRSEIEKYGIKAEKRKFDRENLDKIAQSLAKHYDKQKGGMGQAPKFPMPSIYLFLLRYVAISENETDFHQVLLTLISMAYGGIYDQIGGGFSRYATDNEWNIPHFEKMLYDNGQLVSLYSEAYSLLDTLETDNKAYTEELKQLFKNVVYETIAFVKRELIGKRGNFYCALDADSEGIEGKFYVWTKDELEDTGLQNLELFKKYYNVSEDEEGNWEHGYNILFRTQSDSKFAESHGITLEELQSQVQMWKKILLMQRDARIRPIRDDKTITAWNALMLKGLCDAYNVFGEQEFLDLAANNAKFLLDEMINPDILQWQSFYKSPLKIDNNVQMNNANIGLFHNFKKGRGTLNGYLDDYALVIQAFIAYYQICFEEKWLYVAKALANYTIKNFYDQKEKMFFYTDRNAEKLIARKKEIFDNVIPASNSVMATNLHFLHLYFEKAEYQQIADDMLSSMTPLLEKEARYLSNWACLYTYYVQPTAEVVISGKEAPEKVKELKKYYVPNKIIALTTTQSKLPLLIDRPANEKTLIYVCRNKVCLLPTGEIRRALELLNVKV
jgi:uncharacterized protein YyaL (SSP411 family)